MEALVFVYIVVAGYLLVRAAPPDWRIDG